MKSPLLFVFVATSCLAQPRDPNDAFPVAPPPPTDTARAAAAEPEPALGGPLTLEQALDIALAQNPGLAERRWAVWASAAARDIAAGRRRPSLAFEARSLHSIDPMRLIQPRFPAEPSVYTDDSLAADLVLSFPMFTAGRLRHEVEAAALLRDAAEHRLARTRAELTFNVSSVFYAILEQRRVIDSVESSRAALREHRNRIQDQVAAQRAAHVDLLRTEVRLAKVEQRLIAERNRLAIEHHVLTSLLGLDDDSADHPLEIVGELAEDVPVPDEELALRQAFEQREDYQAARSEVESRSRALAAARAVRWPTLSLEAAYGERWAVGSGIHPPGTDDAEDVGSVAFVLQLPLLEGGGIDAGIRRERADLARRRESLRALELEIRLEVSTSLLNVGSARAQITATEKAVEQGRESLRIEREKYELGKGSITDVLDAQAAWLDAQTDHYRARAALSTAFAEYRLAKGDLR